MAAPIWYGAFKKKFKMVNAASLSVSASDTAGTAYDIPEADRISGIWVNVTAIAGGSATVTIRLQHSPDDGVTWLDTGMTTAALSATDTGVLLAITCDLFPKIRLKALLSSTTTPTATYSAWMGYNPRTEGPPRSA